LLPRVAGAIFAKAQGIGGKWLVVGFLVFSHGSG